MGPIFATVQHGIPERAHRGFVLESGGVILSETGAKLLQNQRVREAYLGL